MLDFVAKTQFFYLKLLKIFHTEIKNLLIYLLFCFLLCSANDLMYFLPTTIDATNLIGPTSEDGDLQVKVMLDNFIGLPLSTTLDLSLEKQFTYLATEGILSKLPTRVALFPLILVTPRACNMNESK